MNKRQKLEFRSRVEGLSGLLIPLNYYPIRLLRLMDQPYTEEEMPKTLTTELERLASNLQNIQQDIDAMLANLKR